MAYDGQGNVDHIGSLRGSVVQLPLPVWVTEKTLPWLSEAAVMRMERYMEDLSFQDRSDRLAETGEWDDWK